MINIPPMKLNTDKFIYVGCIPIERHPEPPTDQSPCTVEICPHCKRDMWVSEKKKKIRATCPRKVKIYCLECLAVGAYSQGMEPTLFDIGKVI